MAVPNELPAAGPAHQPNVLQTQVVNQGAGVGHPPGHGGVGVGIGAARAWSVHGDQAHPGGDGGGQVRAQQPRTG
jgi:hypothetical protein